MVICMEGLQNKEYRYERKYVFHQTEYFNLISQLYKKGFTEIYNPRKINNIYLDNWNFRSVVDNEEGISERTKHRIRWYGESFEKSEKFYEKKIKQEFVGEKKISSLGKEKLNSLKNINKFFNDLNYQFKIDLQPKLYNSYLRKYYSSSDGDIRITLDTELFFYSPVTKIHFKDFKSIIEIKYDRFQFFLNEFNSHNLTKYSKYVKGITQTTFYLPNYSS